MLFSLPESPAIARNPGNPQAEATGPDSGAYRLLMRFLTALAPSLHTREVAGSKPAVPIHKVPGVRGLLIQHQRGEARPLADPGAESGAPSRPSRQGGQPAARRRSLPRRRRPRGARSLSNGRRAGKGRSRPGLRGSRCAWRVRRVSRRAGPRSGGARPPSSDQGSAPPALDRGPGRLWVDGPWHSSHGTGPALAGGARRPSKAETPVPGPFSGFT